MKKIYLLFLISILFSTVSNGQYVNMVVNATDSTGNSMIGNLHSLDGKMLYKAYGKSYSYWTYSSWYKKYKLNTRWEDEVWLSDGTEAGTSMIEINTATVEKTDALDLTYTEYKKASMSYPVVYKGELYFKAYDATDAGSGTYKINSSGVHAKVADWVMAYYPIVDNDSVFYCTADYRQGQGRAILAWDGVNTPDTLPYQMGNYTTSGVFFKLGNKFLVTANATNDDPNVGAELFLYDPSNPAGPQLLYDIDTTPGKSGAPKNYTQVGDKIYFQGNKGTYPNQKRFLLETDGTPEGTKEVAAIMTAIDSVYLDILGEFNGKLLYTATWDGTDKYGNNAQMFSYDPASETVTQISDVPGHKPMSILINTNNVLDGWMYYGGGSIPAGSSYPDRYLFRTDGSVVEQMDTVVTAVADLVINNGKVYFEGAMPGVSKLSDGTLGTSGYELMVFDPNTQISCNAFLGDLTIPDTTIADFDKYNTMYEVVLPAGTTVIPQINGVADDAAYATIVVTQAPAFPGIATIVVTAQDGTSTNTYSVEFREPTTVSTLSDLTVDGVSLSNFDAATLTYDTAFAYGYDPGFTPVVIGTTTDINATVELTDADTIPGTTTVVVTAEDGTTKTTYTIGFTIVPPKTVSSLSDLTIDGETVVGFDAATLTYDTAFAYGYDPGITPVVTCTLTDDDATFELTDADTIPGTTTIVVTAQDGETITTYTIDFTIVAPRTVSSLSDLTMNDVTVVGFDAGTVTYDIELPIGHPTDSIPTIDGVTTDTSATYVVANPAAIPGTTTVVVTAQDGTTETTYSINYTIAVSIDNAFANNSKFKVYPTVSDNHFNVELGQNGGTVKVLSVTGQLVMDKEFYTSKAQINIEKVGMYFILISDEAEEATFKIIKK